VPAGVVKGFNVPGWRPDHNDWTAYPIIDQIVSRFWQFLFTTHEMPAWLEHPPNLTFIENRIRITPTGQRAGFKQRLTDLLIMRGVKKIVRSHRHSIADALWTTGLPTPCREISRVLV
jgi:hypothetical protein